MADADLVVVGGPTHAHGMSRASTRKAAVAGRGQAVGGLKVEPDAPGTGLRDWFGWLGRLPGQGGRLRYPGARVRRADRPGR